MPKGVEHFTSTLRLKIQRPPQESLMPKGVEHISSWGREVGTAPATAGIFDAERR